MPDVMAHRVPRLLLGIVLVACRAQPHAPTPTTTGPSAQIQPLGPPQPPVRPSPLERSYTVTLTIGSTCSVVPVAERTRTYSASIERGVGAPHVWSAPYVVTLTSGTFLQGPICTAASGRFEGIGCHQFFASKDTDTASFALENNNDEAHGGHIVEQSSSGTWLEITGSATGPFSVSGDLITSIDASGTGSVWYCPTPSAYPFPCGDFVACSTTDLRLTLTRN